MGLRLGSTAPDFTAASTEGPISFHSYIGDSWAMLFSHPKDFTPICTTELGRLAQLKGEFDARNVKLIQLTAKHRVATPVEWHRGEDVAIAGSVGNDEAREIFGSWTEPKPYIRIVAQPA